MPARRRSYSQPHESGLTPGQAALDHRAITAPGLRKLVQLIAPAFTGGDLAYPDIAMNLLDGLNYYKTDSGWWSFTLRVEGSAVEVVKLIALHGDRPNSTARAAAHSLLIDVEKWKAMCLRDRMVNAERNSPEAVWDAFRGALNARDDDLAAIFSIMRFRGFGSSRDEESGQRRAKVATPALRFLKPESWGVVDWRTVAMLGLLDKSNGDVDKALMLAKKENAAELRKHYEIVDERGACAVNQMYRDRQTPPSYRRAVDVEMAVFGVSLMAWPMPK